MGGSLQVKAAHGLVEVSAPTIGQARRSHAAGTPQARARCTRSAPPLRPLVALCATPTPLPHRSPAPLRAQAFAWQAAIARSARAFHEQHGTQHALAMLLPLQGSDATPAPAVALVTSLWPLTDAIAEHLALPPATRQTDRQIQSDTTANTSTDTPAPAAAASTLRVSKVVPGV